MQRFEVEEKRGNAESGTDLPPLDAMSEAAIAHRGLDAVLCETAGSARELLSADVSALLLVDESGRALARRAAGGRPEITGITSVPLDEGLARRITRERKAIAGPLPARGDLLYALLGGGARGAWAAAAVAADGQVLGVIAVGRRAAVRFESAQLNLLGFVADRAAGAIRSAVAHEQLVSSVRAMRRFVSLAAHELRTPASAICGIAATLGHRGVELSDADSRALIETLYEQSELFGRTVNQLLDMSRLDHAATVEFARVEVRRELDAIVAGVGGADRTVEIAAPAGLHAMLDRDAFRHVVSNLVVNAVHYGGPPVTITAEQRDTHFRLDVRDEGAGVPEDFVPYLFEPFRRGPATATSGTGLGLAIARSYAQALGGDLLYEPARPRGARFTLVVPQTLS
jgi:signal transduction histidine kinase